MKKPRIKHVIAIGATCLLVVFIVIIVCDVLVTSNAKARTFDDVSDVPHNKVGLLLATSPITPQGEHNYYFDNRVKAADELYKAGKVDFIIASGGDYTQAQPNGCDEPSAIRDSLVARGIPENRIVLDYDGTRTLNSIAKAREVYDLDSLTLISQKYHNERAIYLADKHGLHAVGYNAAPSPVRSKRIKNTLREYLARVKMFIDVSQNQEPMARISKTKYEEIKTTITNYLSRSGMSEFEQKDFIYELCDTIHPCLNSVFFKYNTTINGFNVEGIFSIAPDGNIDYQGGSTICATLFFSSDSLTFSIHHPTFKIPTDEFSNTLKALDCIELSYNHPIFPNPQKIPLDSIRDLPFAFIDIDFDGNKELLLSYPGNGQKNISTYNAYALPELNDVNPFKGYIWNCLDEWTVFDYETQTIISSLWGGYDGSEKWYFKYEGNRLKSYKKEEYTHWFDSLKTSTPIP